MQVFYMTGIPAEKPCNALHEGGLQMKQIVEDSRAYSNRMEGLKVGFK
jgi:hypothetical protein